MTPLRKVRHDLSPSRNSSIRPAGNDIGYTHRDYEGKISRCAYCGHDSITAFIEACYELRSSRIASLISGIGCSWKTLDISSAIPTASPGARPHAVGVDWRQSRQPRPDHLGPGDGDKARSVSPVRALIRRGVNKTYIVENNGVYGLTKDNSRPPPIAPGNPRKASPTPTARSTSSPSRCNWAQASWRAASPATRPNWPLIAAAIQHKGAAFIDAWSAPASFNNHARLRADLSASTMMRELARVITGRDPITVDYAGIGTVVEQHDGIKLALRKLDADYDPHDRLGAMTFLQKHAAKGQITGLLYVDPT